MLRSSAYPTSRSVHYQIVCLAQVHLLTPEPQSAYTSRHTQVLLAMRLCNALFWILPFSLDAFGARSGFRNNVPVRPIRNGISLGTHRGRIEALSPKQTHFPTEGARIVNYLQRRAVGTEPRNRGGGATIPGKPSKKAKGEENLDLRKAERARLEQQLPSIATLRHNCRPILDDLPPDRHSKLFEYLNHLQLHEDTRKRVV